MPKRTSKRARSPSRSRSRSRSRSASRSPSSSPVRPPKSAKKRNNPLWDHFELQKDWVAPRDATKRESYLPAVCKHCMKAVTRIDGNTSNMKSHLQHHSAKYHEYQKALKADKEEKVSPWNLI